MTDTEDDDAGLIGGDYHKGLHCCQCNDPLKQHSVFFELLAATGGLCHVVCPACCCAAHAERGCSHFQCPSKACSNIIIGHSCVRWNNKEGCAIADTPVMIAPPNDDLDAHRIFTYQPVEKQEKNIVLSASFVTNDGRGRRDLRCLSATVPTDTNCEEYDEILQRKLLVLSRLLYHVFMYPPMRFNDQLQKLKVDSMERYAAFALHDPSFLIKVFTGIITGKSLQNLLPKGPESNPYQRSNYLAIYTGLEIMKRATTMVPGILQNAVQKHLAAHGVPDAVRVSLCRLRIASSREKVRLDDIKKVKQQLIAGWDLTGKRYWLIFVMYDNLGFRIKGAKAGYDQYINIIVHFISPKQLQTIGLYLPPNSPQPPLSRVRSSWDEIRKTLQPSSILPTESDYTSLGFQVYSIIDALLEICNDIPSVDQARELLRMDGNFDVDCRLPTTYGAQRRLEVNCQSPNIATLEVEQEEAFVDEVEIQDIFGEASFTDMDDHIEFDIPMHADLAKKNSVRNLSAGALELRQIILAASASVQDPVTLEAPIMEDHGVHQGADGSPTHSFHTIRDENPHHYKDTYVHGGPFHKHLATLNGLGRMFADSHLWHFLHTHRDTDPKKEFFLYPSDPGQTMHELPEMTAPHYVAAIRNVAAQKGGEEISAVDVHEFMLQRALQHDHCMVLLMWLHFVEISNIIRDSEGVNDPELYRTGATLALLLFAKTNATKYVRMGLEDFIWWNTASEADRKIYDAFYFTKKTVNGKYIWFDRFVEWINKDVRFYLGKYAKPCQERLMQRTMALLKENRQIRREDAPSRPSNRQSHGQRPSTTRKEVAISPIFCQQLDLVYRHNYWGEGPVLVGKHEMREPQTFTDPTGHDALNRDFLFVVSRAEDALTLVFQECMLGDDRRRHTEMDTYLRRMPVLLKGVEQERKDELTRLCSTDIAKLSEVATVSFMKTRIDLLRDTHTFLAFLPSYSSKDKKDVVAGHLAAHHRELHRRLPGFQTQTKRRLQSWYDKSEGFAPHEQKKDELLKPFYKLTDAARQPFVTRKYSVDPRHPQQQAPATPGRAVPNEARTPMIRRMTRLSLD